MLEGRISFVSRFEGHEPSSIHFAVQDNAQLHMTPETVMLSGGFHARRSYFAGTSAPTFGKWQVRLDTLIIPLSNVYEISYYEITAEQLTAIIKKAT